MSSGMRPVQFLIASRRAAPIPFPPPAGAGLICFQPSTFTFRPISLATKTRSASMGSAVSAGKSAT